MRKDIFIVGARLLGLWLLVGSINPLCYVIVTVFVRYQSQPYAQEYNIVNGIAHLLSGLYLVFRTNTLFHYLDRLADETSEEEDRAAV